MIAQMRSALVNHARLDGSTITGFEAATRCRADFTTARGLTPIDWSQLGSVPTRLVGSNQVTILMTGEVSHQLSIPNDASTDADGVRGAIGQLAEACGAATSDVTAFAHANRSAAPMSETTPLAQMHASMVKALEPIIIGHAAMDGEVITDVRQVDACHTAFYSSKGETTIAWAQAGNVVGHLSAGRRGIALTTNGARHILSVPIGGYPEADAAGVDGAAGQMAGECGAY